MFQREGWEYLTLVISPPWQNTKWGETLDERGKLGWQLVTIDLGPPDGDVATCIFKRSIGNVLVPPVVVERREPNA